jgi:hypothetical protein
VLKLTLVLVSGRRRSQARCKDLIIVKFIRKGLTFNRVRTVGSDGATQEMEAKTQNGGPHLLELNWRAGGDTHGQG